MAWSEKKGVGCAPHETFYSPSMLEIVDGNNQRQACHPQIQDERCCYDMHFIFECGGLSIRLLHDPSRIEIPRPAPHHFGHLIFNMDRTS